MSPNYTRRELLVASGATSLTSLAGCLGSSARQSGSTTTVTTPSPAERAANEGSATPTGESSSSPPPTVDTQLPLPLPPPKLRDKVASGGVSKDGIPSIDQPQFESAEKAASRLTSNAIVFGVVRNGVPKAYPQNILVHHEICNDVIKGEPVSITYCPLTGTALGFTRGETSFGVSGRLVNNNLIMYDRANQRWWPQVPATSLPSPWHSEYTRRTLHDFRVIWTTWDHWQTLYPETRVLTRETGYVRNYDKDPYGEYNHPDRSGYYAPERPPLFDSLSESDRYAPKRSVIGARTSDGAVAFLKDALREQKLMEGTLAGPHVLAVYDPRLDTGYVYNNPNKKSISYRDGQLIDEAGTAHAPNALSLPRIFTFQAMWFAWNGFYPETNIYD